MQPQLAALPWILGLYTLSFPLLFIVTALALIREHRRGRALQRRFKGVVDVDTEIERIRADALAELRDLKLSTDAHQATITELQESYRQKRAIYDQLLRQVAIFDETVGFAEVGLYQPHFDFSDSDTYKANIAIVRGAEKEMVSAKTAVVATTEWTVNGNRSAGQTMSNRNIRLTLRAFNGEADAAVANVRWSNAAAMEKRVTNAREQIDKLNASNATQISQGYLDLKLRELRLTHEYREKLKEEREERAEQARLQREEQKLQRDIEAAESEESRYAKLLDRARIEAAAAVGGRVTAYAEKIALLERDLAEARAKVARAQAMAERTRSGYVYIISNVGSFGSDIVKIGLTRRLDPTDRVKELGDASVPFLFDTHAIIYSDDAPSLEHALHQEFEPVRVNTSNLRKEFFRASLAEVESAVRRLAPTANFFSDIEAQEYRESVARRQAAFTAPKVELMPTTI